MTERDGSPRASETRTITPRQSRPATLLDAIVLIAAAAIALAMARGWPDPTWFAHNHTPPIYSVRSVLGVIVTWTSWTIPFGITLTIAVLVLRFRSPRPRFARIARQPGAAACAAALFAMAARMAQEASLYALAYLTLPSSPVRLPSPPFTRFDNPGWHRLSGRMLHNIVLESFPLVVSASVGIAVVVAWGIQWAGGRCRPEPSWIDRAGRLLGAYWIALAVAVAVLEELWGFLI